MPDFYSWGLPQYTLLGGIALMAFWFLMDWAYGNRSFGPIETVLILILVLAPTYWGGFFGGVR